MHLQGMSFKVKASYLVHSADQALLCCCSARHLRIGSLDLPYLGVQGIQAAVAVAVAPRMRRLRLLASSVSGPWWQCTVYMQAS